MKEIPEKYANMSKEELDKRIKAAKKKLGKNLVILGHHYQRDEVVQYADFTGDSLKLCQIGAKQDAKYIVFCGVHFMAESADVLGKEGQRVILPDLNAGCSMADMAPAFNLQKIWPKLQSIDKKIIPITYVNSAAAVKAFVGKNKGACCTSSNAQQMLKWAFSKGDKVLFLPDEHLGRYSALQLGIKDEEMFVLDPKKEITAEDEKKIRKSKMILWKGFCYVHTKFLASDVDTVRKKYPGINVLVHPECPIEVVKKSDFVGSTEYIIKKVTEAPAGSKWAVGTEVHLVNRLKKNNPDKFVTLLSNDLCLCGTMFRITQPYLLWVLEELVKGNVVNEIKVKDEIKKDAFLALDRMMEISHGMKD